MQESIETTHAELEERLRFKPFLVLARSEVINKNGGVKEY
jgi:hypothetical protein